MAVSRSVTVQCAAAALFAVAFAQARAAEVKSVAPDISVAFVCRAGPPSEDKIEGFLKERGFDVDNEQRVERQFDMHTTELNINGIDAKDRSVTFIGLRTSPPAGGYAPGVTAPAILYVLMLHTPPPTVHDVALETALSGMVSDVLGCTVSEDRHGRNPAEAADFYTKLLAVERARMKEIELCDQADPRYDAKACTLAPGTH